MKPLFQKEQFDLFRKPANPFARASQSAFALPSHFTHTFRPSMHVVLIHVTLLSEPGEKTTATDSLLASVSLSVEHSRHSAETVKTGTKEENN